MLYRPNKCKLQKILCDKNTLCHFRGDFSFTFLDCWGQNDICEFCYCNLEKTMWHTSYIPGQSWLAILWPVQFTLKSQNPKLNLKNLKSLWNFSKRAIGCPILTGLDVGYMVLIASLSCACSVYLCLHGVAPDYISELCLPVKLRPSRHQLQSSQSNQLIVPPVKLSNYGPRSFAVAGPIPSGTIYLNICMLLNFQLKHSCLPSTEAVA